MLGVRPRYRFALSYKQAIADRAPMAEQFLRAFDAAQGCTPTDVLNTEDPKILVVEFDGKWGEFGPMISAFTSLVRLSMCYDGSGPVKYLETLMKDTGMTDNIVIYDKPRLSNTLPKFKLILEGKRGKFPRSPDDDKYDVHNTGIQGYQGKWR